MSSVAEKDAVLAALLAEIADEARRDEREACANVCEAMVVGGRAWTAEQQLCAGALFVAANLIRERAKVKL